MSGPTGSGSTGSGSTGAAPAEGSPRTRLREAQLLLITETDKLILDRSKTLTETLQFIVDETKRILGAIHVDILVGYPDGLRNEISSDAGELGTFIPFERSISGSVLEDDEPLVVHDVQSDPEYREKYYPRADAGPSSGVPRVSVLAANLTLDEQSVGVVNVEAVPHSFDSSHTEFISAVAQHISIAMTHATLFDEDALRIATDNLLMAGTRANSVRADNEVIMRQVLDAILERLYSLAFLQDKVDAAEILFADPQDDQALVVACSKNDADIGIKVDIGSSVCGAAFRSGQTVLLQRAVEYSDYRPIIEGMRCEMAVPISLGGTQQFPIGVMNLESAQENAFSNVGRALAERFARRVVNAVAMTKLRADIDNEQADQLQILAADQVLNAVHRINNHVGSVRAISRDILADLESADSLDLPELKHGMRLIEDAAVKALEIPNELIRRVAAPQHSVDVNAQVDAGIARVRMPKSVSLVTSLAPGLPDIPCTGLELAVENLLTNAVKSEATMVRVSTLLDQRLPREPVVTVTVKDNGIGMTQEQVARLFEQKQAPHRGAGLGFSMRWTRAWVRRAHGLIDVDSTPGEGTTVHMRFQVDPQMIDEAPEGTEYQ
ncbi:MAG TPA: GAF domain-containing protein [Trebonia sp.]|nr:GAF domain-containing protein [Trebonia sp.]